MNFTQERIDEIRYSWREYWQGVVNLITGTRGWPVLRIRGKDLVDLVADWESMYQELHGRSDMMQSVLQDWVIHLPLREQGTLLTAVRGCDAEEKFASTKAYTQYFRYCVMNPADPREVDIPGAFFTDTCPLPPKASMFGQYSLHYVMHLIHAAEVVGYRHPDVDTREYWSMFYRLMVYGLHLEPESFETMVRRLSEDRIANKTVVS